jgi:NADH:ubiquinone oxidoreductase subunit E
MEEKLEAILSRYRENEGNLISILQDLESEFGYLREDAITWIADQLDVPLARFYGVATFYAQFHLKPRAKRDPGAAALCHGVGVDRQPAEFSSRQETYVEDLKFT